MRIKGTLIPIGGNEDKGNFENETTTLEYIQEGILSRVIQESGGTDASVVIITSATSIPKETTKLYTHAFEKIGCKNLHFLDIRNQKSANEPMNLAIINKADCVMFTGGDQSKITRYIGGSQMHKLMTERYLNDKFIIAGTSAGAMCMSKEMITGGGKNEVFIKGSVSMGEGLGFAPDVIIDSHFIKRRRLGRLAEAVARFPQKIGIGLAEDTGLVIKNGTDCEVIGSGMMILFDPRDIIYNDEKKMEKGSPITITNLKTHILANGNKIDIRKDDVLLIPEILNNEVV